VSHDAHITRAPDWSISDEVQIPLDEWADVAAAAGMVATRTPGVFYARDARESGDDATFEWRDGAITVEAPDRVTLARMIELAELLDAVVQGDDGEEYVRGADGTIVPVE
jgi:hypothetical protein